MPRTFVWHPTRGPKKTDKLEAPGTGKLEVKQVRSGIGHSWRMRATLEALGLKHPHDVVVHQDSAALRGQIKRVRHLVTVAPARQETQANG